MIYLERILDVTTGEEKEIPLSAAEIKIIENNIKQAEENKKFLEEKKQLRVSALEKLAALGLTEDEIAAL